jgi:hypothetical protein
MGLVLYTVADEAYVPGVAALINSARRNGVRGEIHIGSPKPLSIANCHKQRAQQMSGCSASRWSSQSRSEDST